MIGELDDTEETTFAAVGRALSRWEEMEVALADLYTIISGFAPRSGELRDFCDVNRIFAMRIDATESAAQGWFIRFPDQECEGLLRAFAVRARRAARNRNLIAHGLVQGVNIVEQDDAGNSLGSYGYLLIAPYFSMRRLGVEPDEGFGSIEIDRMSDVFNELRDQALTLIERFLEDRT